MTFSLHDRLLKRDLGDRSPRSSIRGLYGDRTWINQLDIVNELGGHNGCVNALSWSKSGSLLASGSDDQFVNIHAYQPELSTAPFKFSTTIDTGHTQNIFSVKFMPHSNDRTIVTAAGDAEIRVFDIEYSGSSNNGRASTQGRRGYFERSSGVQYLSEGDTNARVYRSHTDRVKRIVTESSPHLFLSCSEDGEVRQWDLRQPSSAYPRPRTGRSWMFANTGGEGAVAPPPLISYKRWRLDLNTISCSPSQPHYIALGGAHLHCFLHDRRMLGRDRTLERGWDGVAGQASDLSDTNDELMGEATRCVKRFAPNGKASMGQDDNGHITACKISDSNPNELVASWSHDHIYNFDMLQAPDARHMPAATTAATPSQKSRAHTSADRKRKRAHNGSALSREGTTRPSLKVRRESRPNAGRSEVSLRVRYENGQSEQFPIDDEAIDEGSGGQINEQSNDWRIAKALIDIKSSMFSLDGAAELNGQNGTGHEAEMTRVIEIAASVMQTMESTAIQWRYPVDPDEVEVIYQRKLRQDREAACRFMQAVGVVARLNGGQTTSTSDNPSAPDKFLRITPAAGERSMTETSEQFCFDFIKAITLWLNSGPTVLIEGFTSRRPHPRFPVPKGSGIEAIDDFIIPYLLQLAGHASVPNLDVSRFEVDENRVLFGSEKAAVLALAAAIRIPFQDLSGSSIGQTKGSGTPSAVTDHSAQDRRTALRYWGFRVARGVLKNASDKLRAAALYTAFGGTQRHNRRRLRRAEREASLAQEDITLSDDDDVSEDEREGLVSGDMELVGIDEDDIEQIIDPGDWSGSEASVSDDLDIGEDDNDDDDIEADNDDDEDDDGDDDGDEEDSPMLFRLGLKRATRRAQVNDTIPCSPHIRQFRGHCNVKTVKDVNFFGRGDEYVVSGSDCGHLFIWDRASAQLVNILKGDKEVVNVIQAHPYEPTLAVSGIDHTIKIFSPDQLARRDARRGVNLCNGSASDSTSSLRPSRLGIRRSRLAAAEDRRAEEAEAPPLASSDATDTEDEAESQRMGPGEAVSRTSEYVAPEGLVSRRRMHHEYRIISANDEDRQAGTRSTFLTASMLAQLFAGAEMENEGDEGNADDAGEQDGGGTGRRARRRDEDGDDENGGSGAGGRGGRGIQVGFVNGRLTLRMA